MSDPNSRLDLSDVPYHNQPMSREQVVELHKEGCNFLMYGYCETRACLVSAGWTNGPTEGVVPTCPYRQAVDTDATLRAELQAARLSESINVNQRNDIIERVQAENERLLENLSLCKGNELANQVDDLTAQLAASEQQVTALESERNSWPTLRLEGADAQVVMLQQQLVARTAERDELYNKLYVYQTVYGGEVEPLAPTGPQHRHTWVEGRCSECGQSNRAVEF